MKMKRQGFNLIELVVILIIVGIVSVISFVALNPYKGVKLDAAAKKVAADLQYVRNLALSTAKWYGISFEADPVNTYTVYETDGTTDTVIKNPADLGKNFIIDLNDSYGGITIDSVDIGGGNKVEFHPLGKPYTDKNDPALGATGRIIIGFSGITKDVTITPNTGRIDVD
ncbi:MAG: prepilin-type N-terminal cleavage/methylation domain-containing protein [Candidatus Margulisiibacteriota bacterium]